jgi:hypothetical protein
MSFEAEMETGRTTSIVVKTTEHKGQAAVDVRKTYNGNPTKKGAFLVIESGQHEFVQDALPKTLEDNEERAMDAGSVDLVVRRYDFEGMQGYAIRKEAKSGKWGKGIWLNPNQAAWVAEQISEARKTL